MGVQSLQTNDPRTYDRYRNVSKAPITVFLQWPVTAKAIAQVYQIAGGVARFSDGATPLSESCSLGSSMIIAPAGFSASQRRAARHL
jgi:hypothetical protein